MGDAVAGGWDRHHEVLVDNSWLVAQRLVGLADPQPGSRTSPSSRSTCTSGSTFDDYWQHISETSGPLTVILQALPHDEVGAIRATCERYAPHPRTDVGSYPFPSCALVAAAR